MKTAVLYYIVTEYTSPQVRDIDWKGNVFMAKLFDILVVGAGYAGAVAARTLAEAGKKQEEEVAAEPAPEPEPPAPSNEEVLLAEIRDLLKNK